MMDALTAIKSRRVSRSLTDEPVDRTDIETILECARWAPVAGNDRIHRFVAVHDANLLKAVRMVSPGMFQKPQAAIVICSDWERANANRFSESDYAPHIDLGAAMQTILLAAQAVGLGSGPVTSFSKAALGVVLDLPDHLTPEIIVCLGHRSDENQLAMRTGKKLRWQTLVDWNRDAGASSLASG